MLRGDRHDYLSQGAEGLAASAKAGGTCGEGNQFEAISSSARKATRTLKLHAHIRTPEHTRQNSHTSGRVATANLITINWTEKSRV